MRSWIRRMSRLLPGVFLWLVVGTLATSQVAQAYCAGVPRTTWSTTWTMQCNVPSAFQSKIRTAMSRWDAVERYTYTEQSPCPPYAYNWGYVSFAARGYGSSPGRTLLTYSSTNKVSSAASYLNSDKVWYNSTVENETWPSSQYDRLTVALHEAGHWMQLYHPSDCGNNHPEAVMEPTFTTKTYIRTDDLDGLLHLGVR